MARDPQRLVIPAGMHYECVQCGKSCRTPWDISIDEASAARLAKLDLDTLRQDSGVGDVLIAQKTAKAGRIFAKTCSSCPFLQKDNLCAIHAAHGHDTKPQVCQDFPYRYVETPTGTYVGLSFACTAVLRDHGPTVESQRPLLNQNYPKSLAVLSPDHPQPRIDRRREISWEAYEAIEEDLDEILAIEGIPVGQRIVAQSIYLDMACLLFRQVLPPDVAARTGVAPADSGTSEDIEVAEVLHNRFIADGHTARLVAIAAKVRAHPMLQRAFIGMTTAFHHSLVMKGGKRPTRAQASMSILRHYLGNALGVGSIQLGGIPRPFRLDDFRRIRIDLSPEGHADRLLTRYLRHCLFRKDLLLGESVWLRQRHLAIYHALARWHAIGRAAADGAAEVSAEHFQDAVRDVEAQYNLHMNFARVFEELPTLAPILDAAARRPTFAGAMTGPTV